MQLVVKSIKNQKWIVEAKILVTNTKCLDFVFDSQAILRLGERASLAGLRYEGGLELCGSGGLFAFFSSGVFADSWV